MGPFSFPRRVAFGECDPARIIFAPRAVDYAVEAIEAWYEAELEVSWADLVRRRELEARVAGVECEYQRPLVAGQQVEVRVRVTEVRGDRFTLSAIGELAPGEAAFRARLAMVFAEPGRAASLPIPTEYRQRLEALRDSSQGTPSPSQGEGRGEGSRPRLAARLSNHERPAPVALRQVQGERRAPFTQERRVVYGDCGVAGTAYPPKIIEHAVEAAGEWYEACLGVSWLEQCLRGRGTPFVNIRCDYLRPITPGVGLALAVTIPRLGRASIGYQVVGRDGDGVACFHADMSACHVTQDGGSPRATPFPDAMRERILAYQAACGAGG